tara:strand:+ start:3973 stop:4350 length:378 start_codon:yes stop_codon:yes gene_type:complete
MNTALQNIQADSMSSSIGAGTLTIYSGTVPADSNTALSGQVAKAIHSLAGFGAAVSGVATANAIADAVIGGTGTESVSFARLVQAGNTIQLPVGTSGAPVIVSSLSYTQGGNSIVNAVTITQPAT